VWINKDMVEKSSLQISIFDAFPQNLAQIMSFVLHISQ